MTSLNNIMPHVPRTRQPRIQAPRSQVPERDESPVRLSHNIPVNLRREEVMDFSEKEDNLTDVSIDSFSSEINLLPNDSQDELYIGMFNDSISSWIGQEYVMQPVLNRDPNSRLDWDRWASPVAEFVNLYFPDELHNNPLGLRYPYCGVMAYFINRCINGDASAVDYLACLLHRVLSTSVRSPLPMLELLADIFPFMRRRGLVEHYFFKNLHWNHERRIGFVMWERTSFVLHTTLPVFEHDPTYPLYDATIFSLLPEYHIPLRMRAPVSGGPLVPAPRRPRGWLSTADKVRKEKILKASVAVTRGRRETQLPIRYKV